MFVYDIVMVFGTALLLNGCSVMELGNEYLLGNYFKTNKWKFFLVALGKCGHFQPQTSEVNFTQTSEDNFTQPNLTANLTTSDASDASDVLQTVPQKLDFHQSIAPFEAGNNSLGTNILGAFHIPNLIEMVEMSQCYDLDVELHQ